MFVLLRTVTNPFVTAAAIVGVTVFLYATN